MKLGKQNEAVRKLKAVCYRRFWISKIAKAKEYSEGLTKCLPVLPMPTEFSMPCHVFCNIVDSLHLEAETLRLQTIETIASLVVCALMSMDGQVMAGPGGR